jgi:hypothetical protein
MVTVNACKVKVMRVESQICGAYAFHGPIWIIGEQAPQSNVKNIPTSNPLLSQLTTNGFNSDLVCNLPY